MSRLPKTIQSRFGQLRSVDWLLVLSMFVLILFGLSAIYSVELSFEAGSFFNMKKQIIASVMGLGVVGLLALSNYKLLSNYSLILYITGIVLLSAVLVLGETIRGAQGWFVVGPVSFQPVEFMKVALVIALASYFGQRARRLFGLKELLESLGIVLLPIVLVLLQPDLGSAFILGGIWLIIVLFAGLPWRYILTLAGLGAGVSILAWNFFLAVYQKARILTFLDPSYDPLGQGYNVAQAIIAIGAGGWFGRGLGFGSQSQLKFLPESQTDFIFAVIAEELGFIGVIVLLAAFILLFARLFYFVKCARDNFTAYLLLGIIATLSLQILVNIGMNLGLFPVTGIGLPLVSYGGSSIVFLMALLGIAQSVAMRLRRPGSS